MKTRAEKILEIFGFHPTPKDKNKLVSALHVVLEQLDKQRMRQYSKAGFLGVTINLKDYNYSDDIIDYLISKGVLTPIGNSKTQFRGDFERAVAFYTMHAGTPPEFIHGYGLSENPRRERYHGAAHQSSTMKGWGTFSSPRSQAVLYGNYGTSRIGNFDDDDHDDDNYKKNR